jgi:hypothetical protein
MAGTGAFVVVLITIIAGVFVARARRGRGS